MRGRWLVLMMVMVMSGCGPLLMPMVPRLSQEQQAEVDGMWRNMLSPGRELDRQVLLDVLSNYYLYGSGIDRAEFHTEKVVEGKLVQMDVEFDRARPLRDVFAVSIFDAEGRLLRRESYNREEVNGAMGPVSMIDKPCATRPATADEMAEEKKLEWRVAAMAAATQPVGWVPPAMTRPAETRPSLK